MEHSRRYRDVPWIQTELKHTMEESLGRNKKGISNVAGRFCGRSLSYWDFDKGQSTAIGRDKQRDVRIR